MRYPIAESGTTKGPIISSTSEASLPAIRILASSSAVLVCTVMLVHFVMSRKGIAEGLIWVEIVMHEGRQYDPQAVLC